MRQHATGATHCDVLRFLAVSQGDGYACESVAFAVDLDDVAEYVDAARGDGGDRGLAPFGTDFLWRRQILQLSECVSLLGPHVG
jgi:hypothetical protein